MVGRLVMQPPILTRTTNQMIADRHFDDAEPVHAEIMKRLGSSLVSGAAFWIRMVPITCCEHPNSASTAFAQLSLAHHSRPDDTPTKGFMAAASPRFLSNHLATPLLNEHAVDALATSCWNCYWIYWQWWWLTNILVINDGSNISSATVMVHYKNSHVLRPWKCRCKQTLIHEFGYVTRHDIAIHSIYQKITAL